MTLIFACDSNTIACMNHYSTTDAARRIGVTSSRIRQICIQHEGFIGRKFGRDWLLTDTDLRRILRTYRNSRKK